MSAGEIEIRVPAPARRVCQRLARAGHEAYCVGGAVRDALLGREPGDWDVATSASPEQVMELFRHPRARTIPTGLQHGTVTVVLSGSARAGEGGEAGAGEPMPIEVTTFRGDGAYSDGRHPDSVVFGVPLREDLARRDFVINAIAYDPVAGRLADPFDGAGDLAARRVRAVGDPAARFGEDGLRVMRAIRFAAVLEFDLDPATEAAIPGALPVLAKVSAERVRDELVKTLRAPVPSRGLVLARRTGVLAHVLPELDFEPRGDAQLAADPRWARALARVDACAPDPIQRLGALLLALPALAGSDPARFADAADRADAIGRRLTLSNAEREHLVALVRHGVAWREPPADDPSLRALLGAIGRARAPDVIAVWRAERAARASSPPDAASEARTIDQLAARAEKILHAGDALCVSELVVSGGDVIAALGLRPGKIVGELLRELLARVLADPALNDRARLTALLPEIHAALSAASRS